MNEIDYNEMNPSFFLAMIDEYLQLFPEFIDQFEDFDSAYCGGVSLSNKGY